MINKQKIKNTKGKLKEGKITSTSTTGNATPPPSVVPMTPFLIFENSIQRARNLISLKGLGSSGITQSLIDDAYRAAIVLAVSALDAFVRTLVIEKIIYKIGDPTAVIPEKLKQQVKDYLGQDAIFDGARKGDLLSRIERSFRDRFEEQSFQGVKNITDAMHLIGHDNVFHTIASTASVNEDNLKTILSKFTKRRHLIGHCGDFNLNQSPPIENSINENDVVECIKTTELVAHEINKLR